MLRVYYSRLKGEQQESTFCRSYSLPFVLCLFGIEMVEVAAVAAEEVLFKPAFIADLATLLKY
jgi:hypothetical protein